jgi:drug/metabolite transporter (DMT)-like permease
MSQPPASVIESSSGSKPPLGLVIAAFAAVYIVWGSTYFTIHIAIGSIPPFLMAGTRFVCAGLVLSGFLWLRGVALPRGAQWRSAFIVGALLLLIGNGGVTWSEKTVPSSLAALMVATVPLWMIALDWARPGGKRPRAAVFLGLALGFAGVALIVGAKDHSGRHVVDPLGAAALLAASLCWAIGSLYSKHAPQAAHPLMAVGAQMICGGGLMLLAGFAGGEAAGFHLAQVSRASWLALVYLTFIGALVGFTAYVWLLRVCDPAKVSTYAYVNPLIAVLLGCWVGHEPMSGSIFAAGALIIGAVVLITTRRAAPRNTAATDPSETPASVPALRPQAAAVLARR